MITCQNFISYLVVEADGAYDILDHLKVIGAESSKIRSLQATVFNKSLTLKRNKIKIYNGDIFDLEAHKFDVDCYILIDPLKKDEDKKRLLIKIKNLKKKKFIIAVNMSEEIFSEDFVLIKSIKASDVRSLYFFKLN